MADTRFEFFGRPEYFRELIRCANAAGSGDRLTVMTMVYDPSVPLVAGLMQALTAAAGRGAGVTLVIDAFSFLLSESDKPGPLFWKGRIDAAKLREPFRAAYNLLQKLRDAGGTYHVINRPDRRFTLPVAGRSHIKLALVNDRIFIGGCNLDDDYRIDIMAAWKDAATADWLRQLVASIAKSGSVKKALGNTDQTHAINQTMSLFVDSGVRKQSLILGQARKLIDEAKEHVMITCQYFPGGETARRLLAAHKRGVEIKIYFGDPRTHGIQTPGQWLYNTRERMRLPAGFFATMLPFPGPKLHAKIIATESAALIGSHNYVQAGVNLGTAEIALLVRDPAFAKEVTAKLESLL